MKKNVVLVMALVMAQLGFSQQVKWGVKAGYSAFNLDGFSEKVDYVSGVHAGATAEFKVAPKFAIQPELLYSMEGGKYSYELNAMPFYLKSSEEVKLSYLNLPIVAKYYVAGGLSLEAGPQIGYLLKAESEYQSTVTFDGETFEDQGKVDIKDNLKSINYGLHLGLGYELKNHITFQFRYQLGLSNISEGTSQPTDEGDEFTEANSEKIKSQGFQFSIGYKF